MIGSDALVVAFYCLRFLAFAWAEVKAFVTFDVMPPALIGIDSNVGVRFTVWTGRDFHSGLMAWAASIASLIFLWPSSTL